MAINLNSPIPSVSSLMMMDGIKDMICRRMADGVIDHCFTCQVAGDAPNLFVHVITGSHSKLRAIRLLSEPGKGQKRVMLPPLQTSDPNVILEQLKTNEPVECALGQLAMDYSQLQRFGPAGGDDRLGQLTDKVVAEFLKIPHLHKIRVAMINLDIRNELVCRYLINVKEDRQYCHTIWINQYLHDDKPCFVLRGPITGKTGHITSLVRLMNTSVTMARRDCKEASE